MTAPKKAPIPAKAEKNRSKAVSGHPPVMIITEQNRAAGGAAVREFLAALAAAPDGIKLIQRMQSEDNSKDICLWQAPSVSKMNEYLQVSNKAAHFVGNVGWYGAAPIFPQITQIFPFSYITPGGWVIIGGSNFGKYVDQKSQFRLIGSIPVGTVGAFPDINGQPTIELDIKPLDGAQWSDTFATGQIPAGISGVLDQAASLQIVSANGKPSNLWTVQFRAQRQVVGIPSSAFQVIACGGGDDTCWAAGGVSSFSVAGTHGTPPADWSDSGTDLYSCELRNQFMYDHYEWQIADGINGGPFGADPDPVGSNVINLKISWFHDVSGNALYALNVYAVGPVGLTGGW